MRQEKIKNATVTPQSPPVFSGRRAALCWLASAAGGPLAYAQSATPPMLPVRFAPERDYGPFIYQEDPLPPQGLSMDVLQAIAPAAGLDLQVLPARPLAEILKAAQAGEVDLISSLRPTPERGRYLGFTAPYATVPAVLVTLNSTVDGQLAHWSRRPVAVGRGFAVETFVRERFPRVDWVPVESDLAGLQALASGLVQGLVADVASVRFAAQQHRLPALRLHPPIGFEYPLCFGWRKSWPELGQRLDQALRHWPPTQSQALRQRWLGSSVDIPGSHTTEHLQKAGVALSAAALAGWGWSLARRRSPPHAG